MYFICQDNIFPGFKLQLCFSLLVLYLQSEITHHILYGFMHMQRFHIELEVLLVEQGCL